MPYLPTYVWPGQCAYVDFSLSQPMFPQSAMAETVLGSRQMNAPGSLDIKALGVPVMVSPDASFCNSGLSCSARYSSAAG